MLPAGASVGPVDLDHPHLLINQIAGQAGAVAAGALHADHTDLAVVAEPALQLPVAATISRELPVAEQASLCIEHGSVVGATVGVDPADDNPGPLGHAGVAFLLEDRAGGARTGRAGGHTSEGAWSRKLLSGHTSPSGRVHHSVVLPGGRQLP